MAQYGRFNKKSRRLALVIANQAEAIGAKIIRWTNIMPDCLVPTIIDLFSSGSSTR